VADEPPFLLRSFRFQVKLLTPVSRQSAGAAETPSALPTGTAIADGAFQECTGLEVEMDVQELQEGGRNDGVVRRIGRAKYSQLVLKRGMFFTSAGGPVNADLWNWFQGVVSGTHMTRCDGIVEVMSVANTVVARWAFDRGLPAKIIGPQLNARTGEVAIEELHIAHEGLRLSAT
jgi:phage tail-like protein